MHEFGIIQSIVKNLLEQLEQDGIKRVVELHFRRSSVFSEEILRQTVTALSFGTPLAGAKLVIDVTELTVTCDCGYSAVVNSDMLVGHIFICPQCANIRNIEEAHDLELIEVLAVCDPEGDSGRSSVALSTL